MLLFLLGTCSAQIKAQIFRTKDHHNNCTLLPFVVNVVTRDNEAAEAEQGRSRKCSDLEKRNSKDGENVQFLCFLYEFYKTKMEMKTEKS